MYNNCCNYNIFFRRKLSLIKTSNLYFFRFKIINKMPTPTLHNSIQSNYFIAIELYIASIESPLSD